MQDFKNVSSSPVDVGGRVLAVAEIATLSPDGDAVQEAVATGVLAPVTDQPDQSVKTEKTTARKGSAKTTEES